MLPRNVLAAIQRLRKIALRICVLSWGTRRDQTWHFDSQGPVRVQTAFLDRLIAAARTRVTDGQVAGGMVAVVVLFLDTFLFPCLGHTLDCRVTQSEGTADKKARRWSNGSKTTSHRRRWLAPTWLDAAELAWLQSLPRSYEQRRERSEYADKVVYPTESFPELVGVLDTNDNFALGMARAALTEAGIVYDVVAISGLSANLEATKPKWWIRPSRILVAQEDASEARSLLEPYQQPISAGEIAPDSERDQS
jgi:hypothetical protein